MRQQMGVALLLELILLVPTLTWIAFVLHRLWQWFAVPVGAPAITYAQTVGIVILLGFIRGRMSDVDDPVKAIATRTGWVIGHGAWFLALGWVVAHVIGTAA